MLKQYFSDGLVQIAIVLSLLRTDLNSYIDHNYVSYPEVQDIILGQSAAITQTNFHNLYNYHQGPTEILRKNVENDYYISSSLFREIRSFQHSSQTRNFDIPTFLIVSGTSGIPDSPEPAEVETSEETQQTLPSAHADSDEQNNNIITSFEEALGAIAPIRPTVLPGSDPTREDLDLIEVLWRQDIDLGVGKEAFDANLRTELEREREIELQKEKQKKKEAELLQQKLEDQQRQNQQRWLADNFTQDGETGEWVPLGGTRVPPPPPAPDLLPNGEQPFLSSYDNLPMIRDELPQTQTAGYNVGPHLPSPNNTYHQQGPPQAVPLQPPPPVYSNNSQQQQPQQGYSPQVQGYNGTQPQYNRSHLPPYPGTSQQQPGYGPQPQQYPRQDSVEQAWMDLVNVLDLQPNQTMANMSGGMSGNMSGTPQQGQQSGSRMMMNNMMVNRGMPPALDNSSSVLIQNATLPSPPLNNNNLTGFNDTGMVSPAHSAPDMMQSPGASSGIMSPSQSYNSSMPSGGSLNPLDWNATEYLFPNITNDINRTESLEDVDELLPELITEDELDDINFAEMGLNDCITPTPSRNNFNDDASSDSAVSMGSTGSPQTDYSDAMSPLNDAVEGATGGEGYSSSSGFSKTSKYDPDDYKYSNSCSYGYGDSGSNFSSSSNDTDNGGHFSPPSNGHINRNINHNHTYPQTPGKDPKDMRKSVINNGDKPKHKGPHCRDEKRVQELKIPFTLDQIVSSPVEEFNDLLTRHKLSETQLQLVRDIRRRGKNKVAAQNCRKRKMDMIDHLENDMGSLERMRDKLLQERHMIDKQTRDMKEKYGHLYAEIFHSLRDEHGRPYDPARYSLQQSSDGDVFLVPRNITADDDMNKKKKHDRKYD